MVNAEKQYGLIRQMVEPWNHSIFHLIPVDEGTHWFEDNVCWCVPISTKNDLLEQRGINYTLWVHRSYTPKGENGNGI